MANTDLLLKLTQAVESCVSSQAAVGYVQPQQCEQLVQAVLNFGQADLVGNRALDASLWAVLEATECAFPLLLSVSLDKARQAAQQKGVGRDPDALSNLWILQGASDGCLAIWADKVRSQPQIYSAYRVRGPLRSREQVMEFCAAVEALKGMRFQTVAGEHAQQSHLEGQSKRSTPGRPLAHPALPGSSPSQRSTGRDQAAVRVLLTATDDLSNGEAQPVRLCLVPTADPVEQVAEVGASRIEQCDKYEGPLHQPGHLSHDVGDKLTAAFHFLRRKVELSPQTKQTPDQGPMFRRPGNAQQHTDPSGLPSDTHGRLSLLDALSRAAAQQALPAEAKEPAVRLHLEIPDGAERSAVRLHLVVGEKTPEGQQALKHGSSAESSKGFMEQAGSAHTLIASATSKLRMPAMPQFSWLLGRPGEPQPTPSTKLETGTPADPATVPPQKSEATSVGMCLPEIAPQSRASDSRSSSDRHGIDVDEGAAALNASTAQPADGTDQQREAEEKQPSSRWPFSSSMLEYLRPAEKAAGSIGVASASPQQASRSDVDKASKITENIVEKGNMNGQAVGEVNREGNKLHYENTAAWRAEHLPQLTPEEQLLTEAGLELSQRMEGTAQDLLDVALEAAHPLQTDDPRVRRFCSLVVAFLHHGFKAPQGASTGAWIPYLHSSPEPLPVFALLQAAHNSAPMLDDAEQSIRTIVPGSGQQLLEAWILSGMKQHVLGSRILSLSRNEALLQGWYSRAALIRQEGVVGGVLGLLVSLDGVTFQDPQIPSAPLTAAPSTSDPAETEEDAEGVASYSFLNKVGSLLMPRAGGQPHPGGDASASQHSQLAESAFDSLPLLLKSRRKASRSVDINNSDADGESSPPASPDRYATPAASLGLLSPLSSTELSAEPLSPSTLAFFRAARNHAATLASSQPLTLGSAERLPIQGTPFSAEFLAAVVSKLPTAAPDQPLDAAPASQGSAGLRTESDSQFLEALLADDGPLLRGPHGLTSASDKDTECIAPPLASQHTSDSFQASMSQPSLPWGGASTSSNLPAGEPAGDQAKVEGFKGRTERASIPHAQQHSAVETTSGQDSRGSDPRREQGSQQDSRLMDGTSSTREHAVAGVLPSGGSAQRDAAQEEAQAGRDAAGNSKGPDVFEALRGPGPGRREGLRDADAEQAKGGGSAWPQATGREGEDELGGQGGQASEQDDSNNTLLMDMDSVLANWPVDADRWVGRASSHSHQPPAIRSVRVVVDEEGSRDRTFTQFLIVVEANDSSEGWEVTRRFREFAALAAELKGMHGSLLPAAWGDISKARAVTGASRMAPEVVSARRAMLQRCLEAALAAGPPLSTSLPLLAFLSPPPDKRACMSSVDHHDAHSGADCDASSLPSTGPESALASRYGSRVRLMTTLPAEHSEADLLLLQRGLCAGCREALPAAKASWIHSSKGARRCCYSGLLYCTECHSNATAVIPANVLHHWDFTRQPVSNVAREYLASIMEQPLLCIGAINPGLYARVPLLARAHKLRQNASKALAAARTAGLEPEAQVERLLSSAGQRRQLLESAEFWALRDLVDLSKGAFSELPQWLESAAQRASKIATSVLLASQPSAAKPAGR